jgi:hypothetical protein
MREVQQKIFQSSVFQKLGTLKSSTRNPHLAGFDVRTASLEIEQLRYVHSIYQVQIWGYVDRD